LHTSAALFAHSLRPKRDPSSICAVVLLLTQTSTCRYVRRDASLALACAYSSPLLSAHPSSPPMQRHVLRCQLIQRRLEHVERLEREGHGVSLAHIRCALCPHSLRPRRDPSRICIVVLLLTRTSTYGDVVCVRMRLSRWPVPIYSSPLLSAHPSSPPMQAHVPQC